MAKEFIRTHISWQGGAAYLFTGTSERKNKEGKCHSIVYVSYNAV